MWISVRLVPVACAFTFVQTNKQNVCVTDGRSAQGPEGHFVLNSGD